ncbi:MAG: 23S rRNA (uracil(1939)-C(5))-methyltransferase RlmD [Bacilli bacterium]|nr:23S rRNA (uracil(1939)-C(5))-methyltransferase RlmD [Bacilli bacterium]
MKNIIKGKCVDISSEGKGVIKTVYGVIFVDSLLLGEEAEIEVTYARKGVAYGKVVKLLSKSPDRIQPLCPVSTACGGCTFQNASYDYELRYKKHKVEEDLKRIGHFDNIKVNDVIGMENPEHYRNKIQVPFGRENKRVVYGFYRSNTHKIIPIKECNIEDKKAGPILKEIASLMEEFHIDPYNEDYRTGIIRHVLIRTSLSTNEIMVVFVSNVESFPGRNNFIKELVNRCPQISTIVFNVNKRDTNVILGESEKVLYGRGFITDEILGLKFNISSQSFFQVNPIQVQKLYGEAIKYAKLDKNDTVLDAYAGVCTIGLLVAPHVKKVTSVEVVKSAVINGKNNAKLNKIENIEIIEDDCTLYINRHLPKFDVVIMDPPRKGSTPEFLNALLKIKPSRIVYISCEPSTLARDLEYLKDDYIIDAVQPVDMFPRSFHVETIVGLYRK